MASAPSDPIFRISVEPPRPSPVADMLRRVCVMMGGFVMRRRYRDRAHRACELVPFDPSRRAGVSRVTERCYGRIHPPLAEALGRPLGGHSPKGRRRPRPTPVKGELAPA